MGIKDKKKGFRLDKHKVKILGESFAFSIKKVKKAELMSWGMACPILVALKDLYILALSEGSCSISVLSALYISIEWPWLRSLPGFLNVS